MNTRLLPFALLLLAASSLCAQDYPIQLTRPCKAGDEMKFTATAHRKTVTDTRLNGVPQNEVGQDIVYQLDATQKIIAVDPNGQNTKVSLTVDKFTQTTNGINVGPQPSAATTDLLPKGAVITCSVDAAKKKTYEVDGTPVAETTAKVLDIFVELNRGGPTDDESFGTKDRKKKGESWDVNAEMTKKFLEATADGEFSNVAGKSTLQDVTPEGLVISTHFTADGLPQLPPSITADKATVEMTFTGVYPLDVSKFGSTDSLNGVISLSAHGTTPRGELILKTDSSIIFTRKTIPLPTK